MPKSHPVQQDEVADHEGAAQLILELAMKPPVKGMANMKAASDVFEANLPGKAPDPRERTKRTG